MATIRLPGLVDIHVHTRDPGQTHKEDWASATAAALAGGFTTILAMPNTDPPLTDLAGLVAAETAAERGARCDYALYAGATSGNAGEVAGLSDRVVGLKMYLNATFGDLRLGDLETWWAHLEGWPRHLPVVVHAEGPALGAVLLMAGWQQRPLHVCHVSRRDEILLIARAKDHGLPVTCEVTPHHLVLDEDDEPKLGPASAVRPPLATPGDRAALWEHLDAIDCIATDHAPHTAAEKAGSEPPPGFPGLETALPLLLTAVNEGRMTEADLRSRLHDNPRRIFGLEPSAPAVVEVDPDERWVIRAADLVTRCDWTPFEGMEVRGRVTRVTVAGEMKYAGGVVAAAPGSGNNLRKEPE